ncbi:MAG: hypothetical protein IJ860_06875 [Eubacterium sp.]|nr:hypothetical protein [Eubacterium sp.]
MIVLSSAGISLLLDWIPAAGLILLACAFLVGRHRRRAEELRLREKIDAYKRKEEEQRE